MKNIKSILIIVGLILVGIVSVVVYNRQQENQFLEFEGYEVSLIERKVEHLYNKSKTDLAVGITEDKILEVNDLILEIEKKDFSKRNQAKLEGVIENYKLVYNLYELQMDINEIFEEQKKDVIRVNLKNRHVKDLKNRLIEFQQISEYYNRHSRRLDIALEQIDEIDLVEEYLNKIYNGDELRDDLTPEELEEIYKIVNQVKNNEIKNSFLARLKEIEQELVKGEEIEEVIEEVELEEVIEVAIEPEPTPIPEREPTPPTRPSSPAPEPEPNPEPVRPEQTPPPEPQPETPSNKIVRVVERQGEEVEIPFTTETIEDDSLAKGEQLTTRYGKPGRGVNIYEVSIYEDGTETSRFLRRDVTREPESKIIRVGTR